jgi:rhodanese-related sulfurtransferase
MQRFKGVGLGVIGICGLVLLAWAGSARADEVVGKFKTLAEDVRMFSVVVEKTGVMLFKYDKQTAWSPGGKATGLQAEDLLRVAFKMKGDDNVATAVSKVEVPLPAEVQAIPKDEIELLLRKRAAGVPVLLIDPRPAEQFTVAHLPGAVSIPLAQLVKRGGAQLPAKKDSILIFYGDGPTSEVGANAAVLARNAGYLDVRLYQGGVLGWVREGGLLETTVEYLRKGRPVLIDLRPPQVASLGFIDGASNFPLATLAKARSKFPDQLQTPLVFYGEQDEELRQAVALARSWGFRQVSVFPGGVKAWQEAGEVLKSGTIYDTIFYSSVTHFGELAPSELDSALGSPRSILFVDVRRAAEYADGHLPKAISVPLEELTKRAADIPKGKILVVYGSSAASAEMAFDFLRRKGYQAMYVSATLTIARDGSYQVR